MANKKALRLIELGLHPVLLGGSGDGLKRPLLKGWKTAVYTAEDVARWPARNNVGIRCGIQRNSLSLLVFDFDEEADRIFPTWRWEVGQRFRQPLVVVESGRGCHVYFYTETAYPGRTLAGRYGRADHSEHSHGRKRLFKFIETLGQGRQVVSAGSWHPRGKRYRFQGDGRYADIPLLSAGEYQRLLALSRTFDARPARPARPATSTSSVPAASTSSVQAASTSSVPGAVANPEQDGITNCLEYARRYIGTAERVEGNGDIRFLGHGGLLVTADGRGWYSFSEETGGGLSDLIAWHRALMGEGGW
jgi:hypothetical protein